MDFKGKSMVKCKYTQILCLAGIIALVAGLSACVYRSTDEDWDRNGKVRLILNWKTKDKPSDMIYYFYKEGSSAPILRYGKSSGYEGTLPAGIYQVAVCNPDGANIDLDMDNGYDAARAVARPVSSLKATVSHVAQPMNLYGTGEGKLDVSGPDCSTNELYPACLVKQVELNVKIVGLDGIRKIDGFINGVSPEIHIPTGKALFDRVASVAFTPEQIAGDVYATSLNLFGFCCGGEGERAELFLNVTKKDGNTFTSSTDISDQVNDAFNESLSTYIVLDLEISPDKIDGIKIELTDWHKGVAGVETYE